MNQTPRPVSQLLSQSATLYKSAQAQTAAILAIGLAPGAALAAAAFLATGITSSASVTEAVDNGQWLRATPLFAAGVVKRLLSTLVFIALVFSLEARHAGRPLRLRECYGLAFERFIPFIMTAARAFLFIFAGMLLFIIPGLVLAVRYSLAHLSVLLEQLRGSAALARSRDLVLAEPWFVMGRLALATLIAVALNMAAAIAVALFLGGSRALSGAPAGVIEGQLEAFVGEFLSGLVGAWLTGYSVLLYKELAARHVEARPATSRP